MNRLQTSLLSAIFLALIACGGGVRGQPPLVRIATVQLEDESVRTRVDISNPNSVEMEVEIFEMSMTLGEADLGRHSANLGISIHPHGTEEIGFDFPSGPGARQTLAELERGDVNSVSYSVEGRVRTAQGDNEAFTQSGYLYPVPGRPGQFRGAGPQRDRPRDS